MTNLTAHEPAATPPDALLVACSDYRWRDAMDAFCRTQLGVSTWDSVLVPGGIYLLSYPGALPQNYRVGSRMLEFLITHHHPRQVVLVNHHGCARYRAGLALPPGRTLEAQQKDDLKKTGQWVRDRFSDVEVNCYYAAGDPATGGSFEAIVS